ncbi:hypothetical protein EHYA_04364 [Embleya hyalina]|uniref:Uncharacterized protein n=1 Tax=Embleya hyalina TaxID=516124 RepID=A0A401YQ09_9ACTN|nr:hypothetical protein EHYA_04364 [Embleya hyalina]
MVRAHTFARRVGAAQDPWANRYRHAKRPAAPGGASRDAAVRGGGAHGRGVTGCRGEASRGVWWGGRGRGRGRRGRAGKDVTCSAVTLDHAAGPTLDRPEAGRPGRPCAGAAGHARSGRRPSRIRPPGRAVGHPARVVRADRWPGSNRPAPAGVVRVDRWPGSSRPVIRRGRPNGSEARSNRPTPGEGGPSGSVVRGESAGSRRGPPSGSVVRGESVGRVLGQARKPRSRAAVPAQCSRITSAAASGSPSRIASTSAVC